MAFFNSSASVQNPDKIKAYLVELVGTFFLVLAVGLTASPWTIGLMLMAMIYMGGHISGGHFNPAVSLAVFIRGKLELVDLFVYMGVQTVGAFIGAVLIKAMSGFPLVLQMFEQFWLGLTYEALMTFVLCIVVLELATSARYKDTGLAGMVIGFTLMGVAFFPGVLNPAIIFGSGFSAMAFGGMTDMAGKILAHGFCPFVGSVLAAYFYKYLNDDSSAR